MNFPLLAERNDANPAPHTAAKIARADDNVFDTRRESQFGESTMANIEQTLEQRIRAIEDRLEIYNLIASHPPSADTGNAAYAEAVYTEDGVFDRGPGLAGAAGNKALGALLESAGHQAAIAGGLAHFTGLPYVAVDGDAAVVISYLQILTPKKTGEAVEVPNHGSSRGYHIHRVVTNRWELVRTASGWKIKRRTIRLVDGSEPSREVLRGALERFA
jgi:hypothetical protein